MKGGPLVDQGRYCGFGKRIRNSEHERSECVRSPLFVRSNVGVQLPECVRILEEQLGLDSQERSIQRVSKPRLETRIQSRHAVRPFPKPDLLQHLKQRLCWFTCY